MSKSSLFNDVPYLPFQIHESQRDIDLELSDNEFHILRELGKEYAQIANLPAQKQNIQLWKDVNSLKVGRPTIWLNEICWHEMNVDDELTVLCESEIGRRLEIDLRKAIYQWNHMAGNMVIDNVWYSPVILENSGFGVEIHADVLESDVNSTIASRHFHDIMKEESDIEQLIPPVITYNEKRTRDFYELNKRIFDGIMPVEIRGCTGFWFAPWDDIAMLKGAENLLMDLALEPEFMKKLVDRLMECYFESLRQFEKYNLLARNDINVRVGSGGYGYVEELPGTPFDPGKVNTINMWGSATPQIFSSVSPAMHEEFGVDFEKKWLDLFGLSYYGCCEPLDGKIDVLSKIENLRKISISPWANLENAAEKMRGKYVVSYKPSPACFVGNFFDRDVLKKELTENLKILEGCCVEIILKDISTVNYKPQNLWEWVKVAEEVVDSLY